MLLQIPEVFSKAEVKALRERLDAGPWADGNMTSGHQSATAKRNQQLPEDSDVAREVSALIVQAAGASVEGSIAQKAASLGIHFNCLVVGAPKNNRNAAGGPKMWRINAPS